MFMVKFDFAIQTASETYSRIAHIILSSANSYLITGVH